VTHIVARVIEVRVCADEADKELSLAIHNEVWPNEAVTMREARQWERRMSDHVDVVARIDGALAGSAVSGIDRTHPKLVITFITVLKRQRRRGVGAVLYGAVSEWASERGRNELETRSRDDDEASIAYATRRGFRIHVREPGLVLDLRTISTSPTDPPAGVEILPYEPRFRRAIHEIENESVPDIPGEDDYVPEPFESWVARWDPDRTFVAVADGAAVGYAKLHVSGARPHVGWHRMTAVRRAWRGRGIAGALKRAQIAWAREAGLEWLEATNEIRNEPIRRLNLKLGYRDAPGRVWLRGPLASE
jgi:GNAT superfamily N-acetyltransferase